MLYCSEKVTLASLLRSQMGQRTGARPSLGGGGGTSEEADTDLKASLISLNMYLFLRLLMLILASRSLLMMRSQMTAWLDGCVWVA